MNYEIQPTPNPYMSRPLIVDMATAIGVKTIELQFPRYEQPLPEVTSVQDTPEPVAADPTIPMDYSLADSTAEVIDLATKRAEVEKAFQDFPMSA